MILYNYIRCAILYRNIGFILPYYPMQIYNKL